MPIFETHKMSILKLGAVFIINFGGRQNMGQNMSSAVPAQQANAVGQMRKQTAEMSGAEYKAEEFKNERVAQMLYANDGGNATFQMGLPEVAQKVNQHVAEQKLMANGVNPQIPFSSNRFAA